MTDSIAKAGGPGHQISTYVISDRELPSGSTFGSPKATLVIKATGALEKVFSCEAGIDVFGSLLLHHWDELSGIPLTPAGGEFIIHPDRQEHVFQLADAVTVRESIFMLNSTPGGDDRCEVDPPGAYYSVELRNDGVRPARIATYASVRLRGGFLGGTLTKYDARSRAFVAYNEGNPDLVRIAACSVRPASFEVTLDSVKTSAARFPGTLSNQTMDSPDDPIGIFHLSNDLGPGDSVKFYFVLTFSLQGEAAAEKALSTLPDDKAALERTNRHFESIQQRAIVMTPDAEVNRGVLWAKANILRTQSLTSQGWCFVNDPARSNNSVARDTAWYGLGSDYVTPEFARDSLLWYIDHLEPSGMVVEYFDIRNGKAEDYGLNINDDTPLIILALWHHYTITGDREFLEYVYPKAQRAAQYILSQRNGQGLVWCTADKTADWGILGWRNVIEGYRLSGASTEVNSECFAALGTMGHMAREIGDDAQAVSFENAASDLRAAINEHLLDKRRNLYYLNIDLDGTPRTDVTCDLVFPVMFGVADHDVAANIIARLSIPEFWTDAGLRTVPRNDIHYSPRDGYGLLGGVWAGPTFWYAFAAAPFSPEFMAYALSVSFTHYSQDPQRNNTVPGQFSEWLHGETLTNQGMMLSPWFAPKYLWAAIEGAGGLVAGANPPELRPRLANGWSWLGVRNICLRGKSVSWFAARIDDIHVFVNHPFEGVDDEHLYDEDITDRLHASGESVVLVAFRRRSSAIICIGNTRDRTVTTSVRLRDTHLKGKYRLRTYNSLRGEWIEERGFDPDRLREGLAVEVSRRGFCILEFDEEAVPS